MTLPPNGEVPANFGELTAFSGGSGSTPLSQAYALTVRSGDGARVLHETGAITGTTKLGVTLEPGETYQLEARSTCDQPPSSAPAEPMRVTLHVGAAAELPTTLGPLTFKNVGPGHVPIQAGASCYADYKAYAADVSVDLAHVPKVWRALLTNFQLVVDGEPFKWNWTAGASAPTSEPYSFYFDKPGLFRAWTLCDSSSEIDWLKPIGLAPGKHTLVVRARVPTQQDRLIESEPIEVELACASAIPPDAGEAQSQAASEADASTRTQDDGGILEARASNASDEHASGEEDVSSDEPTSATEETDGAPNLADGCSTRPSRGSAASFAVLLLALSLARLAGTRRRREKARLRGSDLP